MNILVLDDDENLHLHYRYILKQIKGVGKISMAHDAPSFDRCLSKHNYHVIICDIHMFPTIGPEILRAHQEKLIGKEIILLSCSDNIKDYSKELEKDGIPIRAYFQKPLVPQDLFDLLECN